MMNHNLATLAQRRRMAPMIGAAAIAWVIAFAPLSLAAQANGADGDLDDSEDGFETSTEIGPSAAYGSGKGKPVPAGTASGSNSASKPPVQVSEKTPEVFVPSEDISEDIAVSFPVDI